MSRSVIVTGSRTAIGKLSGQFVSLSAQDLGGAAIQGVLERCGRRHSPRRCGADGLGQPCRSSPDHCSPGGGQRGHTNGRPGDDYQ
jgi:hypothetical protein